MKDWQPWEFLFIRAPIPLQYMPFTHNRRTGVLKSHQSHVFSVVWVCGMSDMLQLDPLPWSFNTPSLVERSCMSPPFISNPQYNFNPYYTIEHLNNFKMHFSEFGNLSMPGSESGSDVASLCLHCQGRSLPSPGVLFHTHMLFLHRFQVHLRHVFGTTISHSL